MVRRRTALRVSIRGAGKRKLEPQKSLTGQKSPGEKSTIAGRRTRKHRPKRQLSRSLQKPLGQPGRMIARPGGLALLEQASRPPLEFLSRHLRGDWGDLCQEDKGCKESTNDQRGRTMPTFGVYFARDGKSLVYPFASSAGVVFYRQGGVRANCLGSLKWL